MILYVDDILIFGENIVQICWIKEELSKTFKMKDLNEVKHFLGLDISYKVGSGVMSISQHSYIERILTKFGMNECKPVKTPMDSNTKWKKSEKLTKAPYKSLLGCLQYLALMSRPDIMISTSILGQFQSSPDDEHWIGLKRICRYLQGSKQKVIEYRKTDPRSTLIGYADADFANDEVGRKSNSGFVYTLFGNIVSWSSKRQQIVTLSSTEAELVALCHASKEGIWLSYLLKEIGIEVYPFTIYEDNMPCIKIAEEPREHQRTKHIDVKYMYMRELIEDKKMKISYLSTEEQLADMFTKPLGNVKFQKFVELLKIKDWGEVLK